MILCTFFTGPMNFVPSRSSHVISAERNKLMNYNVICYVILFCCWWNANKLSLKFSKRKRKWYLRILLEPNRLATYSTISRESPVKFIARTPYNVLLRSSSASAKTSIVSPSRNLNAKKPMIRNDSQLRIFSKR